jgi:competence protein ComEC
MEARENASAARSCLVLLAIAAVLGLIVCVVVALGLAPGDILPGPTPRPQDQRDEISTDSPLIIAVLDVGQGACVVVITPDGYALVADGGRSTDRARQMILPFLAEHGATRVDYLVATNPDEDHIGGLPPLLEALQVGAWVDPVIPTTNETYARLLQTVSDRGISALRARRGLPLDLGPQVQAAVLWPADPLLTSEGVQSHNDNSVVIQITHGNVRFLVAGDVEQLAEEALVALDMSRQLQSDVLVVAHHGSQTSSSAALLDAVSPTVAIIPVGPDNQYGHPHDEAIQRLRFRGIRIYRTDLDGSVVVRSDGEAYEIEVLAP